MSTSNDEVTTIDTDSKPVFPPLPAITSSDFEDDVSPDDIEYYKEKFKEVENNEVMEKLHCTACDRHLGSTILNAPRMRIHPMLHTLVCKTCYTFYNSGEFEKGDDGSELYCRWCGQGGQVYCCAGCPHVFCAKCIKRNFGNAKIKEIENTDDWKCFKCVPGPLKNLKALCWALLKFVDQRERIVALTTDDVLKKKYHELAAADESKCCKDMRRRRISNVKPKDSVKIETPQPKKIQHVAKKSVTSGIQVKKFASMQSNDNSIEKKGVKRAASPKQNKISVLKKPVPILNNMPRMQTYPQMKKVKIAPYVNPVEKQFVPYANPAEKFMAYPRPQLPPQNIPIRQPISYSTLTNYVSSSSFSDNINLSLESLTQGLDMNNIMPQQPNASYNDDLVCTPDFPLEPLCEVTEDNQDDDVQCVTPSNAVAPPIRNNLQNNSIQRKINKVSPENIIQMSESDVTVNTVTGGLKFRIDPKTLSANKMYRLPDGRVFSININPSMPGGYSATIVSLTETESRAVPKKQVIPPIIHTLNNAKKVKVIQNRPSEPKKNVKILRNKINQLKSLDLEIPVEWFQYNVVDAIDSLEYSLKCLTELKKNNGSTMLRSYNVNQMRNLCKKFDRIINTSITRFGEVRQNLNVGFKDYVKKKNKSPDEEEDDNDDDDDVEILPNTDDTICIDENSDDDDDVIINNQNDGDRRKDSTEHTFGKIINVISERSKNTSNNSIQEIDSSSCPSENVVADNGLQQDPLSCSVNLEDQSDKSTTEDKDNSENKDKSVDDKNESVEEKDNSVEETNNSVEKLNSTDKEDTSKQETIKTKDSSDSSIASKNNDSNQENVSESDLGEDVQSKTQDMDTELSREMEEEILENILDENDDAEFITSDINNQDNPKDNHDGRNENPDSLDHNSSKENKEKQIEKTSANEELMVNGSESNLNESDNGKQPNSVSNIKRVSTDDILQSLLEDDEEMLPVSNGNE